MGHSRGADKGYKNNGSENNGRGICVHVWARGNPPDKLASIRACQCLAAYMAPSNTLGPTWYCPRNRKVQRQRAYLSHGKVSSQWHNRPQKQTRSGEPHHTTVLVTRTIPATETHSASNTQLSVGININAATNDNATSHTQSHDQALPRTPRPPVRRHQRRHYQYRQHYLQTHHDQ